MYTPYNAVTGKGYQGRNVEVLTLAAKKLGTTDPRWLTFLQAKEHGWKVSKGSKGTQIAVVKEFRDSTHENVNPNEQATKNKRARVFIKHYTVFNATQVEGISVYGESQNQQATQNAFKAQLMLFEGIF